MATNGWWRERGRWNGLAGAPMAARTLVGGLVVLAGGLFAAALAQEPAGQPDEAPEFSDADLEFFESKIRPILVERCYKCHGPEKASPAGGLRLDSRPTILAGGDTGPAEKNLATLAAEKVLAATGNHFGVRIHIEKRIPVRAGLGGGSSDCAAALLAVNQLAGNAVPKHELLQFAAQLGSDVPFFLSGGPFAIGWGHGERLLRLPAPAAAPVLLVSPAVGIATAEAYGWVSAARERAGRRGAVAYDLDSLSTWGSIGRLAGGVAPSSRIAARTTAYPVPASATMARTSVSAPARAGCMRSRRSLMDAPPFR